MVDFINVIRSMAAAMRAFAVSTVATCLIYRQQDIHRSRSVCFNQWHMHIFTFIAPQDLEPTTNSPAITRTVAGFIQAPAQDPLVCSCTRQCWLHRRKLVKISGGARGGRIIGGGRDAWLASAEGVWEQSPWSGGQGCEAP